VGHGIVADEQSDRAPGSKCNGIDHRPDLIAHLPTCGFIAGQSGFARAVPIHIDRTGSADTIRNAAHGQSRFSWVFRAVMTAATATRRRPRTTAPDFGKRIDQRHVNRRRNFLLGISGFACKLQSGFAHVLLACVVLPSADEVFLRNIVTGKLFASGKTNLLSKSAC